MNPIQDTNLADLVDIASKQVVQDLRDEGVAQIKRLFVKTYVLTNEITKDERTLEGKKKSLATVVETISKVQKGDWSALKKEEKKEE